MKNILKKHWALIGFLVAYIIDKENHILEKLIADKEWVDFVKVVGAIVLSYFWQSNNNIFSKDAEIGGSNVPPNRDEK